jgi:heat shock protein HspQ
MVAPADLIKIFGMPDTSETFFQGTGQYTFEDNNLDVFCLYDYKKTDFYHGLNREDEFYLSEANLKKPLHKRKRKYPTIQEFWESTEP